MTYKAKQVENDTFNSFESFELFAPQDITDFDGNTVTIYTSVGICTVEDLQAQKSSLQRQVVDIEDKITAIQNI